MHPQTFPTFSASASFYVVNDSTTPYEKLDDLYDIDTDANGDSIRDKRYNLVVWGSIDGSTGDHKLFVNAPSGSYDTDAGAIADSNNTAVTTVPSVFAQTAFLISRISLRNRTTSGGTLQILNTEDLRGAPIGTTTGGSSGVSPEFLDSVFRINDDVDITKQISFQADQISTGTARELTVQDTDGTIALTDTTQTISGANTFTTGATIAALTVTGDATFNANITSEATIAASYFVGDGSQLTGVGGSDVGSLDDLTDVSLTDVATNDILTYTGTEWVNGDTLTLEGDATFDGSINITTLALETSTPDKILVADSNNKIKYVNGSYIYPDREVCLLKDVKAANTAGGSATTDTYVTRDLNTIESVDGATCSFLSLSSNEFTLEPGKYRIRAFLPNYDISTAVCRIYDVTNTAELKIGTVEQPGTAGDIQTSCKVWTELTISASTTYRMEHKVGTAGGTQDLGMITNITTFTNSVFSMVEIEQVQ